MSPKATPAELTAILYEGSRALVPGKLWKHRKTGDEYMVMATMLNESNLDVMVAYAPTEVFSLGLSVTWVRPAEEFRTNFEKVT